MEFSEEELANARAYVEEVASATAFDLIYIDYGNGRTTMMAVMRTAAASGWLLAAGEETAVSQQPTAYSQQPSKPGWNSSEVAARGAFGPLAAEIVAQFPDAFATLRDCESTLSAIHFSNMQHGENKAGQPYPVRMPPTP